MGPSLHVLMTFFDEGEMFWQNVSGKKQNVRLRSDSEGESSTESVMAKRSKINNKPLPQEVSEVVIVFDQEGGPDLHPIHITKAIEKEIGQINHARFMGNGRIFDICKIQGTTKWHS